MSLDPMKSKQGKLPIGQLEPEMVEELAKVLEVSKLKGYKVGNWRNMEFKGKFLEYMISAAERHILDFKKGIDFNQETNQNGENIDKLVYHTSHAAYNLLMISVLLNDKRNDLDDRKPKIEIIPVVNIKCKDKEWQDNQLCKEPVGLPTKDEALDQLSRINWQKEYLKQKTNIKCSNCNYRLDSQAHSLLCGDKDK